MSIPKVNVLIVDDRPENLLAMTNILEDLPIQIFTCDSGDKALEMVLDFDFALILLDVQMPGMDGFETAELLYGSRKTKHIPIIFVTAINKDKEHVFRGYDAGAVDYLFKPIDVRLLKSKVNVFIQLYLHKMKLLVANENLQKSLIEKEKAEKRLIQSEKRYEATFNASPTIIITLDANANIIYWNKAAELKTQILSAEVINKNVFSVLTILEKIRTDIENCINKQQSIERFKINLEISNIQFVNYSIVPIKYNEENAVSIQINDISELVTKENQLIQAQKMETIGNLAGGLAHDFNNVLGGITGTVSLLKYELRKDNVSVPLLRSYLDIVTISAKRASDMVHQLLTLSRKQEIALRPVYLSSSLKNVIKICKNTFDKSIKIEHDLSEEYAAVNADPTQIEQVLLNICINASHAMTIMQSEENQGGTLTLKIFAVENIAEVTSEINSNQRYWGISIKDSGVGMSAATLEKIFDPFYTTKDKDKGTGLGLSMVYNIIEQHNGFIKVNSEINVGTEFLIYIPELQKDKERNATEEDSEKFKNGTGAILIVDDELIIRRTASSILNECGYKTYLAKNGVEGIEQFIKHRKELKLVLLDMAMPEKNGLETFKELKKLDKDVIVLLASGFKMDERVRKAISLGISGFIQKPFTMESLSNKVNQLLS